MSIDFAASIFVEHVECSFEVIVAHEDLWINGGCEELGIIDLAGTIRVSGLKHIVDFLTRSTALETTFELDEADGAVSIGVHRFKDVLEVFYVFAVGLNCDGSEDHFLEIRMFWLMLQLFEVKRVDIGHHGLAKGLLEPWVGKSFLSGQSLLRLADEVLDQVFATFRNFLPIFRVKSIFAFLY